MPVAWKPKTDRIAQLIQEEEARIELIKEQKFYMPPSDIVTEAQWTPPEMAVSQATLPTIQQEPPRSRWIPETLVPTPQTPPAQVKPTPSPQIKEKMVEPVEPKVPFWARALQVFAAPFEWVDDYIIKPGLAIGGTATGLVPEVKREAGEDFFEWKKRSWEAWETPGIDINVPWSDESVRMDMKGIIQFAPWLLLPGVGTVGKGARAASGIAGALGKLGKVGKVTGYALEYSPWGVVEKTAGAAMKGTIKAVTKGFSKGVAGLEKKAFGEIPVKEISPVVQKFTKTVEEHIVPARKGIEKAVKEELRPRQAAALDELRDKALSGEMPVDEYLNRVSEARAGGVKSQFDIPPEKLSFTKEEIGELQNMIIKAAELDVHEGANAGLALREFLYNGIIPEPAVIKTWSRVYGDDFAKTVNQLKGVGKSRIDSIWDILNIPRAALASGDFSATLRQGLILNLTHPKAVPRSFWRQLKAFGSEKLSLAMDDNLRADPLYNKIVKEMGVDFTSFRKGAGMLSREEPFYSSFAEALPGVRRSERAFTTYLNEMKMASAKAAYNTMQAQGATPEMMKLIGNFINITSGRGKLPASLEKFAPAFNAILFSTRLQASTLGLPRQIGRMFLSGNPYMRKEAATALTTFVGGGVGLLTLLHQTGMAKVEIDPRSGDFGKIRLKEGVDAQGNPKYSETRIDVWRGYIQYIRFAAQMLMAQRKSAYGNMNKAERWDIASRFLQTKLSPAAGLIQDLWKGENYMGEPLFKETTGAIKTARNRLMPLALQDVMDAMEQSGVNALWTAAPAILGIGVLTYVNDFVRVKEKIAKEMGYDTWDEIDPKTQREIQNRNTELQVAQIDFDRQVMGTAWGDWKVAGNAIEEAFRESVDLATEQYRQTGKGVQYRDKISDSYTARRGGYAAREKDERFSEIAKRLNTDNLAEALVGLGPEQTAIRTYNDALFGDEMYDEFGDYRFEDAELIKQKLRQELGEEMFNYIEEYRGLKFETFPPEFQELMEARKVMKPYWDVRNRVIKLFGERFAETPAGQSLISKLRKTKRLSSPEMEAAYQRFYTQ